MDTAKTGKRMRWVDILRGLAIVLVMLWHALLIPRYFGHEVPQWATNANYFFAPYRMPTLMVLSGMLLETSLRKPLSSYFAGKFRRLAWPYVVWAAIWLLIAPADPGTDVALSMQDPKSWIATGHLWFLFFLLCYYLVGPAIRWVPTRIPFVFVPLVVFAASVPMPPGLPSKFCYFAGFFLMGTLASRHRQRIESIRMGPAILAVGLIALVFGSISAVYGERLEFRAEFAVLSLAGIVGAAYVSQRIAAGRPADFLAFIGRDSLIVYVAHPPIMLGIFFMAEEFMDLPLSALIGAILVLSAVVSIGLIALKDTAPFCWLFEAPEWRHRRGGLDSDSAPFRGRNLSGRGRG